MNRRDYSQGNWSAENIYDFERDSAEKKPKRCVCVLMKDEDSEQEEKNEHAQEKLVEWTIKTEN